MKKKVMYEIKKCPMFNELLTFIKEVHIITNDSKRYDLYLSNKNARKEQL